MLTSDSSMFYILHASILYRYILLEQLLSLSCILLMRIAIEGIYVYLSLSIFLFDEINCPTSIVLQCTCFRNCAFACDPNSRSTSIHSSDVDECLKRDVCPGDRCQNTIGSYVCITVTSAKDAPYESCPPGYQWEIRTGVCVGRYN